METEQHLSLDRVLTKAQLTGSHRRRHNLIDMRRLWYCDEAVHFAQNAFKLNFVNRMMLMKIVCRYIHRLSAIVVIVLLWMSFLFVRVGSWSMGLELQFKNKSVNFIMMSSFS